MREFLIRAMTFLGGLYFFLEFLLPNGSLGGFFVRNHEAITNGFLVVGAMALGLGLVNIFMVHGGRLVNLRSGWINSLGLFIGLVAMVWVTTAEWRADLRDAKSLERIVLLRDFAQAIAADAQAHIVTTPPLEQRVQILMQELQTSGIVTSAAFLKATPEGTAETAAQSLGEMIAKRQQERELERSNSFGRHAYTLLYDGLWTALGAAMFSLLAFYIASAAYRAFRVRSPESAVMMLAAVVVMLGQIPFGVWLWSGFPGLRGWLLAVPSSAAFRAIRIGAAVAGLLMAIRMWFSLDRKGSAS